MKIKHLILFLSFFTPGLLRAQSPVSIDIKQFYAPGSGNYIEVFTYIDPAHFALKTVKDSGLICQVQELLILRQGEKIIDYRKKNVRSPYYTDSTISPFTLVQRFMAEPGKYTLEYACADLQNKDANPLKTELVIDLANRKDKNVVSHIQLVEKISSNIQHREFSRSGYEIWPYLSNFYPDDIEKLAYYAEVYFEQTAIDQQEKFVLTQYLTNFETNEKLDGYASMSKITATPVNPVLNSFDIKRLPTGNYNLVVELRNRKNELVSNETIFFQRLNVTQAMSNENLVNTNVEGTFVAGINSVDSLNEFIACIRPIASNPESDMALLQIKEGNVLSKKQFFYLFWKTRSSIDPEGSWREYKSQVKYVNNVFGTRIKRGYETDRGRVYLKYGAPNQVTDRPNEPSAYPYQIWQYYKAGKYNNKSFIFYMPDLVSNDYEILNSDVPGEYKNPRWQSAIYSRDTQNPNIDFPNQNNTNHYGGNVNEMLKNPR